MNRLVLVALLLSVLTTITEPVTTEPTTTTAEPSTTEPTTAEQITTIAEPSTTEPTTAEQITTTAEPTTTIAEPSTTEPTTAEQITAEPTTTIAEPSTTEPTTAEQITTTAEPTATEPTTAEQITTIAEPTATEPTTTEQITTTAEPTTTTADAFAASPYTTTISDTNGTAISTMTSDSDTQTTAITNTTTQNDSNSTVLTSAMSGETTSPTTTTKATTASTSEKSTTLTQTSTATPVATTATTKTTTTTTTPPVVESKPPNLEKVAYNLTFTLPFNRPWTEPSDQFETLKKDVENTIEAAFNGCPGYNLCDVFKFTSSVSAELFNDGGTTAAPTNDTTLAHYNTTYYSEIVVDSSKNITDYIKNVVSPILAISTVNSTEGKVWSVDDVVSQSMANELFAQEDQFYEKPCEMKDVVPCDPCYWCDSTKSFSSMCVLGCSPQEHKYCQITSNSPDETVAWNYTCSCEAGYLPVGSDCVSDDLIIGLSVGIGVAIIICLTAAIIYLALRKPSHSSGKSDTDSLKSGEVQMEEALVKKSSLGADNPPVAATKSDDIVLVEKVGDGHVTPAAAAAVVVVAAAVVNDAEAAAGAAAVTKAVLEHPVQPQLEPQAPPASIFPQSYVQSEIMTPDYDLSQPMPLNTQYHSNDMEATISTFAPQLQNIDTFGNYSIKRPTAVASGSQPGRTNQNLSYRDFF